MEKVGIGPNEYFYTSRPKRHPRPSGSPYYPGRHIGPSGQCSRLKAGRSAVAPHKIPSLGREWVRGSIIKHRNVSIGLLRYWVRDGGRQNDSIPGGMKSHHPFHRPFNKSPLMAFLSAFDTKELAEFRGEAPMEFGEFQRRFFFGGSAFGDVFHPWIGILGWPADRGNGPRPAKAKTGSAMATRFTGMNETLVSRNVTVPRTDSHCM